ncbi:MAG: cell division protein FtsZ [Alphaproteobacteria bacterium]
MAESNFENLKPKIVVMGVGGAGTNAVNNMIRSNLEGVEFIVANTDAQALRESLAPQRIQLGHELTQGLGAGSKPDIGGAAAEETLEHIENSIRGAHMLFITGGMGGGTGTGAAPVIAKAARALGILTVGVVTKPFHFEGGHRMKTAEAGIKELQKNVDTLIIIPNQNLFRLADSKTTFADAFNMADNVLYSGVRGVTDLMIMPGLINLDFADVRTVMSEMGKAMMGTGEAEGENRALTAAEAAIANPLLDEVSLKGARGVLINITGGMDMTLYEVDEAANHIREQVESDANIIFGSTFDDRISGKIRVSVVATGIEPKSVQEGAPSKFAQEPKKTVPINQQELDFKVTMEAEDFRDAPESLEESEEIIEIQPLEEPTLEQLAHSPMAAPAAPEKSSFFERLGFKKKVQTEPFIDQGRAEFSVVQPTDASAEQEDMDIPAFLRRKK